MLYRVHLGTDRNRTSVTIYISDSHMNKLKIKAERYDTCFCSLLNRRQVWFLSPTTRSIRQYVSKTSKNATFHFSHLKCICHVKQFQFNNPIYKNEDQHVMKCNLKNWFQFREFNLHV